MPTLVYHCPHCGASHEVDRALVGDRVDCRQCGRPFKAAMPVVRPSENADASQAGFRVVAGEGEVEKTLLRVHPAMIRKHPFRFAGMCIVGILGLVGISFGASGATFLPRLIPPILLLIAGVILVGISVIYLFWWWLQTRFTTLTVTNRRTELRRGIISRGTSEVSHDDVRNIQVTQSALERIMGIGDVAVSSSGQNTLEIEVEGLPHPDRVAAIVRDMQ